MSAKLIFLAGTTILSLVLGSVGVAAVLPDQPAAEGAIDGAQIPQRFRARVYGAIESIDGGTLTVASPAGSVDLVTDVNTLFFANGERVTLGDFAVGDVAGALGWWEEGGGVFHAFAVARLAEDRLFPVVGTLTEIDGDVLTIETPGGLLITVHVDGETEYRILGVENPGLDDLEVGMHIVGRGTLNSDGSLQAQMVGGRRVGARGAVRGRVISVGEDNLVVGTARGSLTVLTDERTRFRVPGVEDAGLGDIEVGAGVGVLGTWNEDGSLQALVVRSGGSQER
jgi:hypothetical protein